MLLHSLHGEMDTDYSSVPESPRVRARTGLNRKQGPVTQHAFLTAGGWLVPGAGTLCPPASSHPQFGGSLSLPSTHGCERYPALRNHRSSPYPSPYTHRNNSPSKFCTSIHQLGVGWEDPSGEALLWGCKIGLGLERGLSE